MAQSYTFARATEDDLIVVSARIGNSIVDLVLDSGASHTFIDFGILIKEASEILRDSFPWKLRTESSIPIALMWI